MSVAENDSFMDALRTYLIGQVEELAEAGVVVYHHGESDPDEDVKNGAAKCQGVSALIFELGGDADEDMIPEQYAVELYVDTTKRNRRKTPALRLAGAIRAEMLRAIHRTATLRDCGHALFDTRVVGWKPLEDPAYVACRITLERKFFLT
jgi:hypothetical protein